MIANSVMKFFSFLNMKYDREAVLNFSQSLPIWDKIYYRSNGNEIKGCTALRYNKKLFECKEIKRLAEIFLIDYNKIQLIRFDPDFSFDPHTDVERCSVVIFPVYPILNYNPLIFNHMEKEYNIFYYGPVVADTRLTHSIKHNGDYRINLQFDLDISVEDTINLVENVNNCF